MAESFTSYSVDNDKAFAKALKEAGERVDNLTTPLNLIRNDFYKSQAAIFQLKSGGQYPDLAESTKKRKIRVLGSAYPILRFSGKLESSTTNKSNPNAVNDILDKKTLLLGTLVEYGSFHQSDRPRKKIPLRKFFFIGPEAKRFATEDQMGRLDRWLNILQAYVSKALSK